MTEIEGMSPVTESSAPETTSAPSPSESPKSETPKVDAPTKVETPKPSQLDKLRESSKATKSRAVPPVKDPAPEAPVPAVIPAEKPLEEAAKAYSPNMKLKIMEKDFEIDEFMKEIIKDEKTEKKVRELYEKAIGLDFAKPKHEALQQQYQQFTKGFENLGGLLTEGRMDEFLNFWKIPKEKLYEYVASQLRYEELPVEQKAEEDRKRNLESESRQIRDQNSQLLEQHQSMLVQSRTRDLDTAISRPDISAAAQEYDTRVGKPGAFRNEVINRGRLAAVVHKTDLPVDKAIEEVMTAIGYVAADAAPEQVQAPMTTAPAQKKLPVLPNLGSGGASPVKKQINSISELRALGKQMREG